MKLFKKLISILIIILICTFYCSVVFASAVYESYVYDYWGNVVYCPQAYLPSRNITGEQIGIGSFNKPSDIFVAQNGLIYIADSGNNRIIVINEKFELVKVIDQFINNGKQDFFNNPQGVFVTENEDIYVADTNNARIVHLNKNSFFVREIGAPNADIIPEDFVYKPIKLVLDKAGRIYVIAQNVNQGIIELNADGSFQGYMGASRVAPNMVEYFWRLLSTEEQKKAMILFIPTEYNNICIDNEGFIFVTTSALSPYDIQYAINARSEDDRIAPVRRLNLTGVDVLRRKGFFPPVGDIKFSYTGSITGPSTLVDVAVNKKNNTYSVLDNKRGRVFTYDDEGNLLYVFGGTGDQLGVFRSPSALDIFEDNILVADSVLNSITVFEMTEYGRIINEALYMHRIGRYGDAAEKWQKVLDFNGNYELAYVGVGRALLRQDRYWEAMKNFRYGNRRNLYSRAFQYYRKRLVRDNFGLVLLFLIAVISAIALCIKNKDKIFKTDNKLLDSLKYSLYLIFHPFDGFWDLKHEKRGSLAASGIIILVLTATYILRKQLTGFIFNPNDPRKLNIFTELTSVIIPYVLWCVANWCLTTLMEGEGSFKDILIYTAYSLVPLVIINLLLIPFSRVITIEEGAFYTFFLQLANIWSLMLIVIGTMITHQYSMKKTLFTSATTVVGMGIIVFIGLLVFDLAQQMISFVYIIYREVSFRLL